MANKEQLELLKQGHIVWNNWRVKNLAIHIDLRGADLKGVDLSDAHLGRVDLSKAKLSRANLHRTLLGGANLTQSNLTEANLTGAFLSGADLSDASIIGANLTEANLIGSNFFHLQVNDTIFANSDLSEVVGLEHVYHGGPSHLSAYTFARSKGKIPEIFLRGCGLSDWEIEVVKLYNPALSNEEINNIQYRMYDLRAIQALQISPLFISYSHADSGFVDKVGSSLSLRGVRYWRDIHDMKAGRIEKQIDHAIRQNPTVLLVLSEHSLNSDWVEHEVRTARELEKELERDVLCPVALDDSWRSSRWPKRVMEQIMEYNILDFSAWEDDSKFEGMFHKLIDGLELFYKG
jgi:uncharacterized protein YjbI with pentapeptide repeats